MRDREDDFDADLFLDRVHAADVFELDLRPFQFAFIDRWLVRIRGLPQSPIDDFIVIISRIVAAPEIVILGGGRADAEQTGKLGIC